MEDSAKLPLSEIGSGSMLSDGVQTPELTKSGKPTRTAIRDSSQAWSLWTALENDNRTRTSINSEIVARHTGKPPHDPKELEAHSQNWRSNFPTLSLMGIESRITARLIRTVDNLRVVTNSRLPESFENHDEKSKKFQDRVTSYIRRWTGWRPFISSLCTELVLIGYALPALLDDFNWRIRLFRSDEAFLPQGCAQSSEYIQTVGIKQSFMIHECVEWIEDKEAAEVAGFNVENVVSSTNKATPKNPLWDQPGQGNVSRAYQDLVREGNLGMSYSTGAKGVNIAHVLAIEPKDRRITHYMLDRDNEHNALFFKEGRFDSMNDAICMFTLEPGNSTYYGSKGVGRKCVNITTAMDVTANDAVDAYRLSSLGVLVGDAKGGIATQIRMTNPFVIVTTDAELQQKRFDFNAESFEKLYGKLGQILESAVGEYIPNLPDPVQPGKKDRTATGERIDFQREQEQTVAFVARYLGQFFDMVQPIQRRLCDFETTDEEAKELQKELQEIDGLTQEEIETLAEASTAEVVQDLAAQRNQQMDAIAQKYTGNPNVNQIKLLDYDISAMSSPQVADDLILKDAVDPTVAAEQVRQQIIENTSIQSGNSVNISPRDDDKEHLDVIVGEIKQAVPGLMKKQVNDPDLPQLLDNLNAVLIHGEAHIKSWAQKLGKNPQAVAPYEKFFQEADKNLTKLASIVQESKQQQMAQQGAQQQPQVSPPGSQPPQQGAPAPQGQSQEPTYGGMSEKVTTAWIGQYDKLPDQEKRKLEAKAGLGALQPQEVAAQPNPPQPTPTVVPTAP
jgi:hypothetical protein